MEIERESILRDHRSDGLQLIDHTTVQVPYQPCLTHIREEPCGRSIEVRPCDGTHSHVVFDSSHTLRRAGASLPILCPYLFATTATDENHFGDQDDNVET